MSSLSTDSDCRRQLLAQDENALRLSMERVAVRIEPSCDRAALLALADELEQTALEGDNDGD